MTVAKQGDSLALYRQKVTRAMAFMLLQGFPATGSWMYCTLTPGYSPTLDNLFPARDFLCGRIRLDDV